MTIPSVIKLATSPLVLCCIWDLIGLAFLIACWAKSIRHFSTSGGGLMNYAETILPEFNREMANTRKVLERLPEDKLDWQAHPKSHTIGWNANHLAEIVGWVPGVLTTPSWDIAPIGGEAYQSPKLTGRQELL